MLPNSGAPPPPVRGTYVPPTSNNLRYRMKPEAPSPTPGKYYVPPTNNDVFANQRYVPPTNNNIIQENRNVPMTLNNMKRRIKYSINRR